jgi:hypothetical protein
MRTGIVVGPYPVMGRALHSTYLVMLGYEIRNALSTTRLYPSAW